MPTLTYLRRLEAKRQREFYKSLDDDFCLPRSLDTRPSHKWVRNPRPFWTNSKINKVKRRSFWTKVLHDGGILENRGIWP